MIVASLLLILVAVTLLVLGLTGGSSNLLISSIVASLLAAVTLVIGARQSAGARRAAEEPVPEPAAPEFATERDSTGTDDFAPLEETFAAESAESDLSDKRETVQLDPVRDADADVYLAEDEAYEAGRRDAADAINAARSEAPDESWRRTEPAPTSAGAAAGLDEGDFADADDEDPADEPLPQSVSPADAVRVARLDAEVMVVDGRPRYHLPECRHLIGRLSEPIPVNEAVELGFSPCGLCRPVDRLVGAEAGSR